MLGSIVEAKGGNMPMVISGSAKRARRGHQQIAERRQFRAAADRRAIDDHNHRPRRFHHGGAGAVKGVHQLKGALGRIFADVHPAAESFSGSVEHNDLHILPSRQQLQPGGQFA
jgi:hypothetical protein